MTGPAIRRLTARDLSAMRTMLTPFGDAFGEPDTYTAAQPDDAYLGRLLGGGQFIAIAAMAEGTVTGDLAAYVLPKFEQARSEVYIYDLPLRRNGGDKVSQPRSSMRCSMRPAASALGSSMCRRIRRTRPPWRFMPDSAPARPCCISTWTWSMGDAAHDSR
jgi:hypothetical protein